MWLHVASPQSVLRECILDGTLKTNASRVLEIATLHLYNTFVCDLHSEA